MQEDVVSRVVRLTFRSRPTRFAVVPALAIAASQADWPLNVWLAIGAGLLASGGALLEELQENEFEREVARLDALRSINTVLDVFVEGLEPGVGTGGRTLRANLMILDENGDLAITEHTTGYSEMERDLRWRRGQGCSGQALETGEVVVAPEEDELPVSPDDSTQRSRPWNMSAAQIMATQHLAAIVSVPLRHPETKEIVGVLSLDDQGEPPSDLLGDAIQSAFLKIATGVADILAKGGVV